MNAHARDLKIITRYVFIPWYDNCNVPDLEMTSLCTQLKPQVGQGTKSSCKQSTPLGQTISR